MDIASNPASVATQITPSPQKESPAAAAPDFNERNAKELGFGSYVKQSMFESFVPSLIGIGAGVIGYFTLGKPLQKMFPSIGRVDSMADIIKGGRNLNSENIPAVLHHLQKSGNKSYSSFRAANPNAPIDAKALVKILGGITNKEEMQGIADILGVKHKDSAAKWFGALLLGIPASMAGGIYVQYDVWRRKESARLAAIELDKNIGKLEILRPSDEELKQENIRLRAMLSEKHKAADEAPTAPHKEAHKEHAPHHEKHEAHHEKDGHHKPHHTAKAMVEGAALKHEGHITAEHSHHVGA